MHVRCSKCRGRQTLGMPVRQYVRLPRCKHCRRKMEADPCSPLTPHYYIDRYRARHEVGAGLKRRGNLCRPGCGGCNEYHFPHRRGSGFCIHNARMPESARIERESHFVFN